MKRSERLFGLVSICLVGLVFSPIRREDPFQAKLACRLPSGKAYRNAPHGLQGDGGGVHDNGGYAPVGDSPAIQSPETAARMSGFASVANAAGVALADFKDGREIVFADGVQNKRFVVANGALDCDGIISLPKLKTHGLERMTGCVKNQFGCIPGALKGEFHVKLASAIDFARMLVDLNAFLKPRLYVMDGIVAMEGNGPRGGKARPMNVLLFSTDPIALDATVCRLIDIDPEFIPTIYLGMNANMALERRRKSSLSAIRLKAL